jgi:cell division protein ZapA (FtsZ GTPase activity inhibitor)
MNYMNDSDKVNNKMNIEKRKLKIEIFNDQYSLVSDEKEADVLKASLIVDKLMREIADRSSLQDEKKIAVLAALKIASKLVDLENSLQYYEQKHLEFADMIEKKVLGS